MNPTTSQRRANDDWVSMNPTTTTIGLVVSIYQPMAMVDSNDGNDDEDSNDGNDVNDDDFNDGSDDDGDSNDDKCWGDYIANDKPTTIGD